MAPALQSSVSQKSTVTGVPGRRRGQHFLVDAEVVHRIIETAQIQPYESVLEIGPGASRSGREFPGGRALRTSGSG